MNHIATARRNAPGAFILPLAGILLLGLLTGCQQSEAVAPPLAGSSVGGPFSLIDQDGNRVRDTDFAGRYRLVYFGFANCPDVCPVDLAVAGEGIRQFEARDPERAARVQPIFITVDPVRDTPQVLKSFVANFHPRLIGLTGTEAEIEAAKTEYAVTALKGEVAADGSYGVDHNRFILLFGPQGEPIAIVPHDQGAEKVASELDRWVV
jgi:protein SCO1/2